MDLTFGLSFWVLWVIVALVFIILEVFTAGFAVACFSIGAIAAAIADAVGLSLAWQLVAFSVFTFLAFLIVRPLVIKHFYNKPGSRRKSNTDALIGRKARVTETINNVAGTGRVAIDGDDWKAVSKRGLVIPVGQNVTILAIDSIILTVD